jgi:hypothetical protein
VSDTICCRSIFQIISNCVVICIHFINVCISAYIIVICHFWVCFVNDNENWLLVFKDSVRRGFSLGLCVQRENYSWPEERIKLDHPGIWQKDFGSAVRVTQQKSPLWLFLHPGSVILCIGWMPRNDLQISYTTARQWGKGIPLAASLGNVTHSWEITINGHQTAARRPQFAVTKQ